MEKKVAQFLGILKNPKKTSEEKAKHILRDPSLLEDLSKLLSEQSSEYNSEEKRVIVSLIQMDNCSTHSLSDFTNETIRSFMSDVGEVESVVKERDGEFLVTYKAAINAFLAFFAYDDLELAEMGIRMSLSRMPSIKQFSMTSSKKQSEHFDSLRPPGTNSSLMSNKSTCRYDINIENDKVFEVSRKIIGAQGYNMKSIIAKIQQETGCDEKEVKLRLRGKGSNFLEGPERKECDDKLHLCVSTKNPLIYECTCNHVEALLSKIFEEYVALMKKTRPTVDDFELFRFKKIEN